MAKYINVKTYKRGVKRSDGKGCHCVLTGCRKDAKVSAVNVRSNRLPVWLCTLHATEHGVL